jgi:hypothetical protein
MSYYYRRSLHGVCTARLVDTGLVDASLIVLLGAYVVAPLVRSAVSGTCSTLLAWKRALQDKIEKRPYWRFYQPSKVWPPASDKVNILYLCHGRTHGVPTLSHAKQVDFLNSETYLIDADLACKPDLQRDLSHPRALVDVANGSIDLVLFPFCSCPTSSIIDTPHFIREVGGKNTRRNSFPPLSPRIPKGYE